MIELVDARRSAETKEERHDLFSGLLNATHDDPDGGVAITEQELIGRCQLLYRIALMKKDLTRHPREYVYLPSRWT